MQPRKFNVFNHWKWEWGAEWWKRAIMYVWAGGEEKGRNHLNSTILYSRGDPQKWSLCPHKPGLQPMQMENKPSPMEVHPAAGFSALVGTLQVCDSKYSLESMITSSLISTGTCCCTPQNITSLTKLPVSHKRCRLSFFFFLRREKIQGKTNCWTWAGLPRGISAFKWSQWSFRKKESCHFVLNCWRLELHCFLRLHGKSHGNNGNTYWKE